jgi:three-Cys-motif partner protein
MEVFVLAYGGQYDEIGDWSVQKLKFIENYLPHYLRATKKAMHRYYIDLFAGKGKWIHKETREIIDGSPAISMKYKDHFTKLFYIEMDEERCHSLEQLSNENGCTNVEIIQGDCNLQIESVLKQMHQRAPTFVFVDPSADQVQFATMELLAKWKTELFILFPYQMTIRRYLPRDKEKMQKWNINRLNSFFGSMDWKEIYENSHRDYLLSKMLDFYTSNLKKLGYEYIHISEVFKMQNGPELYMMLWVGKHPVGNKIMKRIYENQTTQLSLFE